VEGGGGASRPAPRTLCCVLPALSPGTPCRPQLNQPHPKPALLDTCLAVCSALPPPARLTALPAWRVCACTCLARAHVRRRLVSAAAAACTAPPRTTAPAAAD
jgi:hypothetical protein